MGETKPGADEIRMRGILRRHGVGYDAEPATVTPQPEARERDWLDKLYDSEPAPAPVKAAVEPEAKPDRPEPKAPTRPRKPHPSKARQARQRKRQRSKRRNPAAPRSAWDSRPQSPRQSLLDAWDQVPYRLKWLLHHAAAAGIGWRLGIVTWSTDTAAWFADGRWMTPSAFVLYGLGICVFALYRRTRQWAWPAAVLAAAPASSFVVGVLLYGTGYHH